MTHLDKAIQYVRDNHRWSEAQEERAVEVMEEYRCSIYHADKEISDEIVELMDSYGEIHGFPADWWRELVDEDEVFINL